MTQFLNSLSLHQSGTSKLSRRIPGPAFGLFPFSMNPSEINDSYFETQTKQIENSAKPVTTN